MKIIIAEDYGAMSQKAFEIIKEIVSTKPDCVLGLATGSTPQGMYKLMSADCAAAGASYKKVTAVNLDEYVGLTKNHDQSYAYFMRENLFDHVDIDKANTFIPDGMAKNLDEECARYSRVLASHRQDVQVLGLGANGHVGFNEPFTPFDSTTHVVSLTPSTIAANARFFASADDVPKKAITMGIGEIMKAKKILLLASGKGKAQAVYDMIKGAPDEKCPASVLQKHPDAIIVLDKDAASLL